MDSLKMTENKNNLTTNPKKAEKSYCDLKEAFFVCLPSQSNIYTFKTLKYPHQSLKFLIASLHKKVYCLECIDGRPALHEVSSCYLPSNADIISLDAFYSSLIEDFIVGITFSKKETHDNDDFYFHIYPDCGISSCPHFKSASTKYVPFQLDFIPYQLYHTLLDSSLEIVWLLSGSDCQVHCYRSSNESRQDFAAVDNTELLFPEFTRVFGVTLCINIVYTKDFKSRTTVTCGESGNVYIFNVELTCDGAEVKSCRAVQLDYPVSCAKFFFPTSPHDTFLLEEAERPQINQENNLSLVVAPTLELSFTIRLDRETMLQLPGSNLHDVVSCCLVCDVDFDGINEILLGTFGQKVLLYSSSPEEIDCWVLSNTLDLPSPVISLAYEDFYRDGSKELIAITMAGIHIFQHASPKTVAVIISRLKNLKELRGEDPL